MVCYRILVRGKVDTSCQVYDSWQISQSWRSRPCEIRANTTGLFVLQTKVLHSRSHTPPVYVTRRSAQFLATDFDSEALMAFRRGPTSGQAKAFKCTSFFSFRYLQKPYFPAIERRPEFTPHHLLVSDSVEQLPERQIWNEVRSFTALWVLFEFLRVPRYR